MAISVETTTCNIINLTARMPFRYGIASLTTIPHLFIHVHCDIDGKLQEGIAADSLIPKWFTKDPESAYEDDIQDMIQVIEAACRFAEEAKAVPTVFDLWQFVYLRQREWAMGAAYPPLLWGFGLSLLERAVLDAYCRAKNATLAVALRGNTLGIRLDEIHPELADYEPVDLLPSKPLERITVRHTVGLSDPLSEKEISEDARLMDGLPQSLESNLRVYGLTHLKIKLSGEIATDVKRLKRILSVLERERVTDYAITLDGNEQFHSVSSLQTYWTQLNIVTALKPMLDHLLYVEQPLHRDAALCPTTQDPLRRWVERPVMIIDESDDQLDSLKIALDCGYCGTSHKNCKGIFKSVANACLLEHLRRSDPSGTYILSGEDLVNTGPVALPQDLAMMANLGVKHVERNGHHYFSGLSMFSEGIQNQVLTSHPDLYHRNAQSVITVKIHRGKINLYSCLESPFGTSISPDLFTDKIPVSNWNFESLLLH